MGISSKPKYHAPRVHLSPDENGGKIHFCPDVSTASLSSEAEKWHMAIICGQNRQTSPPNPAPFLLFFLGEH
ncbi:hypothetical protein Y032_0035g2994 [Ancylostoma ceylanicum]|uniref:Uncharacterized protein n=1 Tax=Ancylostoma ceylanicum TaxID=53326 RepID=A0A016UMV5_9BILA|nr:hypothetical protein Y032_0035g2994 [Ancylostoma ceylanicum]